MSSSLQEPGTAASSLDWPAPVPYGEPGHVPAPVTHPVAGTALVFEGGGMRCTYTAALVQVMLEAGLFFPWVGGISAGTTNTVNMVSRDRWRTREAFVGLPADPQAGGWGSFVRRQGYFNSEHIYRHTACPGQRFPFDWPSFAASTATVRLGAFRCDTGAQVYWGKEHVTRLTDLLPRCQASSSMPGLMPLVEVDGLPYLDGALGPTGGFATDAAAADGYQRMLVVMTREPGYRKPPARLPAACRALFRRYPAVAEGILARPGRYNQTLDQLEASQQAGSVYLYRPERMPISNGELRYDRAVTTYELGLAQARRELPRILEFLGL